ncbi:MAG: 4Fe-4S dicluster domain-containing protein [Candidatus Brocadiia bacterium]
MPAYFIEEKSLPDFLFGLDASAVFAQAAHGESSDLERLAAERPTELALRQPRGPTSLKSFLFPVKERVAVYPSSTYQWQPRPAGDETLVVAGARACDIEAMAVLDGVFIQDDFVDPFYSLRRDALRVVSVDCLEPSENCFCTLVEGKPYAEEGFDVNLSPIEGGYVMEAGSEKGKEMLVAAMGALREATDAQLHERDAVRQACVQRLEELNAPFATDKSLQEAVAEALDSDRWRQGAGECVECGSCTLICPTCHCFQLYDQPSDSQAGPNERMKAWDSCILASYARMAGVGGMKATPRPELRQRFANRLIHKFAWFPENMGRLGCVGCGRCIDGCLGESDVRQLLKDLASEGVS